MSARRSLPPIPPDAPQPGQLYLHTKGGLYRVVTVAVLEATLDLVVVYTAADGTHWIRPLPEFQERFTHAPEAARMQASAP
jgi:hypothetical protein